MHFISIAGIRISLAPHVKHPNSSHVQFTTHNSPPPSLSLPTSTHSMDVQRCFIHVTSRTYIELRWLSIKYCAIKDYIIFNKEKLPDTYQLCDFNKWKSMKNFQMSQLQTIISPISSNTANRYKDRLSLWK